MKKTLALYPPFRVQYQGADGQWLDVFNGDQAYDLFTDAESIFTARSGLFKTVRLIDSKDYVIRTRSS